jgi:hypothetical protein
VYVSTEIPGLGWATIPTTTWTKGRPAQMSQELSAAQRQEIFDLLLDELRRARDAALAGGASDATVEDVADRRRHQFGGRPPEAADDPDEAAAD